MNKFLITTLVLIVMIAIATSIIWLIINGAIFVFESWILILVIGIVIFFVVLDIVLFILPLLINAIPFALSTFIISSYVYGIILWLFSVYISYKVFGIYWLLAGILLGGIGVIPIAIFGSFISQWWPILYLILFLLVLTFITRYLPVLAIAIISVFEERSEINDYMEDEDNDLYLGDNSVYLESEKLSEAKAAELFVENVRNDVRDKWNFIYQELKTFGFGEKFLDNKGTKAEITLAVIALENIPLIELFSIKQAVRIRNCVLDYIAEIVKGTLFGNTLYEYEKAWVNFKDTHQDPLQGIISVLIDKLDINDTTNDEKTILENPTFKLELGAMLLDLSIKRWETIASRFELTE